MGKSGIAVLLTTLLLAYGGTAMARPGAAAGGSDHAGGSAAGKMSTQSKENTNAQWSSGADKGQARAEERRSTEGTEHEKAQAGTKSKTGHTKQHNPSKRKQ